MRISNMHWQQVEAYLARDDRAVLPLGSTEQHAYLSLGVSFDRFVVVLFGIGILYVVGQLLTHFSYDVILRPLRR